LSFWSISEAQQTAALDGRRDASGGRKLADRRAAANIAGTKAFNTVTYSADGSCVIASGNSKYICLYEVQSGMLVKKFTVSVNLSLDGTQEFLNSRNLTEAGPRGLIDEDGEDSDLDERRDSEKRLPGAQRGDASERQRRIEVRVPAVAFSPQGRAFCAASTEGLLVYGLDRGIQFDPFDLDVDVTPETTMLKLKQGEFLTALVMSFRLNETPLIQRVFEKVPPGDIKLIVRQLPDVYLARLMRFIAKRAEDGPHLEFCLRWIEAVFVAKGRILRDRKGEYASETRALMRVLAMIEREVRRLGESNGYKLDVLLKQPLKTREDGLMIMDVDGDEPAIAGTDSSSDDDAGEWMGVD